MRQCGVFASISRQSWESSLPKSDTAEQQAGNQQVLQLVSSLLDAFDRPLVVTDRSGRILFTNFHAQEHLNAKGLHNKPDLNLFADILRTDSQEVLKQLEAGEQELNMPIDFAPEVRRARVRWLPEPDWLVTYLEPAPAEAPADEAEMRQTVQE